jgi:hypothetical protein
MKYFHGCDNPKALFNAIAMSKRGENGLKGEFHVAPKKAVAANYGKYLISFLMAADVAGAHVGLINKDGNANALVGNEVEVVMKSEDARIDFAEKVIGAEVLCPDGRVAEMDVNSGEIICVR